jgi:hypothetical protein
MKEQSPIEGYCLCKEVKVSIQQAPENFAVCHCESCRRWVGGAGMNFNAGQNLKFSGEHLVGRYSSSEWAERGFCKNCGTNLFFRLKKTDHYFLSIGLFGSDISPQFTLQEFIDEKPEYYSFADETRSFTKEEGHKMLREYLSRS